MEKILSIILDSLAHGGPEAIIMLLFVLVVYMVYDRNILIKTVKSETDKHHDDLLKVIEKYQTGQVDLIHALNEIKLILVKLEAKS